jgi:hypothetical protein
MERATIGQWPTQVTSEKRKTHFLSKCHFTAIQIIRDSFLADFRYAPSPHVTFSAPLCDVTLFFLQKKHIFFKTFFGKINFVQKCHVAQWVKVKILLHLRVIIF